MKLNKFFIAAFSAAVLTGCSDNAPDGPNTKDPVDNGEGVYMALQFRMSKDMGQTKSQTTGPNTSGENEDPTKEESNINEVLLILANKTNGFIADAVIPSTNLSALQNNTYRSTAKFQKTDIANYYGTGFDQEINVYVVVNPTAQIKSTLAGATAGDTNWINTIANINNTDVAEPWSKANGGSFLMSNVDVETRKLPASIEDWTRYTTEATAFDLSGWNNAGQSNQVDNYTNAGSIKVHRAAARFDFRDGSEDGKTDDSLNGIGNNTYEVVFGVKEDGSSDGSYVNVTLGKLALVNMNNSFYYFERVSDNGLPTGANFGICKPELPWTFTAAGEVTGTPGNYVISTYGQEKVAGITSDFTNYFNYPFFNNNGTIDNAIDRWGVSKISDVLSETNTNDNWTSPNKKAPYKIWRYSTENTLPADAASNNGQTTGIAFKGKMIATEACKNSSNEWSKKLYDVLNNVGNTLKDTNSDPILYQYAGSIYVTWENIREAAIQQAVESVSIKDGVVTASVNRSTAFYDAIFGTGGMGTVKIKLTNGDVVDYTDPEAEDVKSTNYLWKQWKPNGVNGSPVQANEAAFKKVATEKFITLYQSSEDTDLGGWGYYCYYYYWNYHNDNGDNGTMGPMEFAVVRNNVYKLAVTNIKRLGHPRIAANDPDDPKPDDPDEKSDIYMTVSVQIIPWVVRVNNIEFN